MKLVYFGSSSPLSLLPFQKLLTSSHQLLALVQESEPVSDFPLIESGSINELALQHNIDTVFYNGNGFKEKLLDYRADLIIISCFAKIIPASLIACARYGAINIHPSLLPAFRGPDPLFWQYRAGVEEFGVTLHYPGEKIDAGDILMQEKVKLTDGISVLTAKQALGEVAAQGLVDTLDKLELGNCPREKQDENRASYQPWPQMKDYSISTTWSGRHILNFVSAYKKPDVYFMCEINEKIFKVSEITALKPLPGKEKSGEIIKYEGACLAFACKDSLLECRLYRD